MTTEQAKQLASLLFEELNVNNQITNMMKCVSRDTVKSLFRVAFLKGVACEMDYGIEQNLKRIKEGDTTEIIKKISKS